MVLKTVTSQLSAAGRAPAWTSPSPAWSGDPSVLPAGQDSRCHPGCHEHPASRGGDWPSHVRNVPLPLLSFTAPRATAITHWPQDAQGPAEAQHGARGESPGSGHREDGQAIVATDHKRRG